MRICPPLQGTGSTLFGLGRFSTCCRVAKPVATAETYVPRALAFCNKRTHKNEKSYMKSAPFKQLEKAHTAMKMECNQNKNYEKC